MVSFGLLLAKGLVVIKQTKSGGFTNGMKLDRMELAGMAAYNAIGKLRKETYIDLYCKIAASYQAELQSSFAKHCKYNNDVISKKASDDDKKFIEDITTNLILYIPLTTTQLWSSNRNKELDNKVNSELRKALAPPAIAQATEDVAMAIAGADGAIDNELMMDRVVKEARDAAVKETQRIQSKKVRKKSSGKDETLVNTPTKPGGSTKKRHQKKSTASSEKRDTKTPHKNPKKKVKFAAKGTPKKKDRGSGNPGGSRGGDKKRGAERR